MLLSYLFRYNMKKIDRVIRTQKDLDMLRREEEGKFYIAIAGQIVSFNGSYVMTLISAQEKMAQIAAGQSEEIYESMLTGNKKQAIDVIDIALQTFILPYRIH